MVNQGSALRVLVFHGTSKDDVEQHLFTYKEIGFVKRITDESFKIMQLETTFMDRALTWYMKYKDIAPVGQDRSLAEIKKDILREFQTHKL
jgi:hypothetical protein